MITVNGVSLTAHGFIYHDRRLPRLLTTRSTLAEIPGDTPVLVGSVIRAAALEVDGSVSRDTHTNVLASIDAVAAALRGRCEIRFADIADREWVGRLDPGSFVAALYAPERTRHERVHLIFALDEPYARAQSVTAHVGTNPTLTLGNAPSPLDIDVQNGGGGSAITQIVVEIRTGTNVLRTLTWTGSVAAADLWQLTMDPAWQVTNNGANAIDGVSAVRDWPIADPSEGATNVLVSVTGGSSVEVTTRYRRRW